MEPDNKVNASFWVVVVSSALSCFFSLVSYSLRGCRRVQLEDAFSGPAGRKRLAVLEHHLTALRLTASFCRALANLILLMAMLFLFDSTDLSWPQVLSATAATASVIGIFGIAIPHAWAAYAGEKVLSATFVVLMACRWAMYPITSIMHAFDLPIRRLSGTRDVEEGNGDSAKQEILQAAEEGQAEGAVDPEEVEMIESVIEFGETQAGEIMTPRTDIYALPVETPWREASRRIFEAGHTRVPVYQNDLDNIIGVLYAKDLLRQVEESSTADLREIMRKPFFVPETKPLDDLLREFKARKVHIAIVLDEYGGTAGLVTIEDVLEEIVGDIADEYDQTAPALMNRLDEKSAEVDGRMYIDDVNDALDLELPEDEDYDTIAGLVFSELGYIPTVDETLEAYGAKFTVLAADERKITKLRIELLKKGRDGEGMK